MKDAIKEITEALDQQMELSFFMARKLIELSPPDERKHLKKRAAYPTQHAKGADLKSYFRT